MAADPTFFEDRQPAAILKHGILKRYLQPFVSKTGQFAPDNRVVYLDGFAGPGRYGDGSPGSPALAVQTADAVRAFRELECVYVEQQDSAFAELVDLLQGYDQWTAYHGSVADVLDEILEREVKDAPLFAFLDPFGLAGVSFKMLEKLLRRPRPAGSGWHPPTELLLNISLSGIRRNAGHLTSDKEYPGREKLVANVDRYFGGDWWQDIWRSGRDDRTTKIVAGYCERLAALSDNGSWSWWWFAVEKVWGGPTVYFLAFFTHHVDGVWTFDNALSGAREEYYQVCHADQFDLDPLADREERWVKLISENIVRLLKVHGALAISDHIGEVYGETLGHAREKHVRRAIKELYKAGTTSTPGSGKVLSMRIVPAS